MYCKSCGEKIVANAKFCAKCGQATAEVSNQAMPLASATLEKPKMKLWKKITLGVVSVIVLAVGAAFYFTSGLIEPVDRQLMAFRSGDIQSAYGETSQAFRESTSFDDFRKFVENYPILTKIEEHTFSERKVENGVGYLSGKLITKDGGVQPVEYRLVKENDEWKILGIDFSAK